MDNLIRLFAPTLRNHSRLYASCSDEIGLRAILPTRGDLIENENVL